MDGPAFSSNQPGASRAACGRSYGGSPRRCNSLFSAAATSPYPPSPGCDQSCAVTLTG
ncbi:MULTISPECIES: hypothetical protein [unclassified Streptomyces]|uniref:hypothetical protein n=1 Tax=unclassified Streptomyces TaxID=2593676 RepID=UPI00131E2250|nr:MULTISPECIES: hypothetical protein [unclassified Streptomyces]